MSQYLLGGWTLTSISLPLAMGLFFISGMAGLMHEVVRACLPFCPRGRWRGKIRSFCRPQRFWKNYGLRDAAESHFLRGIELDPTYVTPRLNLGFYYRDAGKSDHAEEQFRKAREIDPTHPAWGGGPRFAVNG